MLMDMAQDSRDPGAAKFFAALQKGIDTKKDHQPDSYRRIVYWLIEQMRFDIDWGGKYGNFSVSLSRLLSEAWMNIHYGKVDHQPSSSIDYMSDLWAKQCLEELLNQINRLDWESCTNEDVKSDLLELFSQATNMKAVIDKQTDGRALEKSPQIRDNESSYLGILETLINMRGGCNSEQILVEQDRKLRHFLENAYNDIIDIKGRSIRGWILIKNAKTDIKKLLENLLNQIEGLDWNSYPYPNSKKILLGIYQEAVQNKAVLDKLMNAARTLVEPGTSHTDPESKPASNLTRPTVGFTRAD